MGLYYKGKQIAGVNYLPRLTLAEYNNLTVKPKYWIRTDSPVSYANWGEKLNSDAVYQVETSPSTHAYAQGDRLVYNGETYIAKTAIAVNDVLVVNTNIELETIGERISDIDLTSGGIIEGNLQVQRDNSYGIIGIGKGTNSSENGILQLYDKVSHYANIRTADNLGANRDFYLPAKGGTIATGDISCDSVNNEVEFGNFATTFKHNGTTYQNVNIAGVKINYKDFTPARWVIMGYVLSGSSLFGRFVCVSSVDTERAILIEPQ